MSDDGSEQGHTWPMPSFRFEVDLGADMPSVAFQEVSGIDAEIQSIEYRHSNSPLFSPRKMPGLVKHSDVTLKRGIFVNDDVFWTWINEIKMNTIRRRTVVIKLLDEDGKPVMQWRLDNAWPTKISGPNLKADANEVAIDTLVLAHERLEISTGN